MEAAIDQYETFLEGREIGRHKNLCDALARYAHLFKGKRVLDYGASRGLSAEVLISLGAASVVGVEIDPERVEVGTRQIAEIGLSDKITLMHTEDTTALPFETGAFDFILSNAVFEHIPQPRKRNLQEVWRLLADGGHFLLTETPNKYWPQDKHTTGLWFNHWLPKDVAMRRAKRLRMPKMTPEKWEGSGWRGLGYYEMVAALSDYVLIPESSKLRHKALSAVGIPASIIDPYPDWLLQKRRQT